MIQICHCGRLQSIVCFNVLTPQPQPFPYIAIPLQVIGDIVSAHDLDADERLIVGKDGLLLISSDLSKHEPILMSHLSLMSRNLFMSSLFQVIPCTYLPRLYLSISGIRSQLLSNLVTERYCLFCL